LDNRKTITGFITKNIGILASCGRRKADMLLNGIMTRLSSAYERGAAIDNGRGTAGEELVSFLD